jgi:hypothetical protein
MYFHVGDSWTELRDVFLVREKACIHVYVLPHALVKFLANLGKPEYWDTGKLAQNVIKASSLKPLRKVETYCSSIQTAIIRRITDFSEKWIFKNTYNCSMANEVTEFHFKILSDGINHFYSADTWKRNTY